MQRHGGHVTRLLQMPEQQSLRQWLYLTELEELQTLLLLSNHFQMMTMRYHDDDDRHLHMQMSRESDHSL
jgi:hypothetical protein